jgi:hypothetical protein
METIKILAYSDSKYEYQIESLIKSLHLRGHHNLEFIYYTVGFNSSLNYKNLTKKFWPLDTNMKRFPYYKPGICLDALRSFGGNIIFLDSDIIIGKRFNPDYFLHNNEYPVLSVGNWELPYYFTSIDPDQRFPIFNISDRVLLKNHPIFGNVIGYNIANQSYLIQMDGIETPEYLGGNELSPSRINDYHRLMKYYGVENMTMTYVYSCFMSFNSRCEDFIEEWKSITENPYLNKYGMEYYPVAEETAINVLLWKRGITHNYGRLFVNTLYSDVVRYVEDNENLRDVNVFGNPLQRCENSKNVQFYHGMLDPVELEQTIKFIEKNNI